MGQGCLGMLSGLDGVAAVHLLVPGQPVGLGAGYPRWVLPSGVSGLPADTFIFALACSLVAASQSGSHAGSQS